MSVSRLVSQFTKIAIFAGLIASFGMASAHTALKESVPANESTVQAPPAEINLVFNGPVRLVKLEVIAAGQALPTEFKPSAEAVANFSIATPNAKAGDYTVNWAAIGADGHTVSNSFSFVVSAGQSIAAQ